MDFELRLEVCDDSKHVHHGSDDSIEIEVGVVSTDLCGEQLSPVPGFLAGVLSAHVARMEDAASGIS